MDKIGWYRHNKTGHIYCVLCDDAIECTNGREEKRYVIYTRASKIFVREYGEFMQKFTAVKKEE